jgi:hypothetical protein
MAIGSGLAAQFGISDETTYGTYVAPTKFFEIDKENLGKQKTVVQGGGLAAGRLLQLGSRRVITTVSGSGSVDLEVPNKGFGAILKHITGSTAAPVQQGATAAYLQTHTVTDNIGRFFTAQVGVPDTTGTVRPYSFVGGKVTGASFSCAVTGLLTCSLDCDFKDVSEAQGLAAASYTAGLAPFHGGQMAVKIGTYNSEAAISGVKKVDIKFERGQATERFYAQTAGAPGTKVEPIMNDFLKITGTLEQDFVDKTSLADKFSADTSTALVIEWVGPIIASTFKETFRIKLPMVFFDTGTPDVENTDVTTTAYNFTAQYDGTNGPLIVEYMSTDITL